LRWKNPRHEGPRPTGRANFDTPPSAQEAARALDQLAEILGSDAARRMGDRLYIQFFNEIGGGPGRFDLDNLEAMVRFATDAVSRIRSVNENAQICGPAVSGQQLHLANEALNRPDLADKSALIERWLEWT